MKKYKLAGFDELMTIDNIKKIQREGRYTSLHKQIVKICTGRRILDIGCGLGSFAMVLAQNLPDSEIIGVDDSDDQIEVARELYKSTPNLTFGAMNAQELKFDTQEFNCACFLEVIEHLEDPVKALKEIYRILKPGAKLILSTNNVYYWRFFLRQIICDILRKEPKLMIHHQEKWGKHLFAWDISTLCTLLNHEGFSYCSHFYVGRFGLYSDKIILSRWFDALFAIILPFFRTTTVVILEKMEDCQYG